MSAEAVVHAVPAGDLVEHEAAESCWCKPSREAELFDDGSVAYVIVHHALDGREPIVRVWPVPKRGA